MPELDSQHPEPAALAGFACGSLPVERAEIVANHVASCTVCAAAVEASTDRVIETLNEVLRRPTTGSLRQRRRFRVRPRSRCRQRCAAKANTKTSCFWVSVAWAWSSKRGSRPPNASSRLKVIQPDLTGHAAAQSRLLREAKALRQLNHPNIVGIYDVEAIDDLIVIVMEYLDGDNLLQLGRGGHLSVGQASRYMQQAARGLQHAHEQGFVHRDIKPENLKIGGNGEVKILDFGLVRSLTAGEASQELTADDVILGTPKYMAPEQAQDPSRASVQTDLYALGCTLFYLLAGRPPFQEKTVIGMLMAQANQEPPAVRKLCADVPPALESLLRRLLAKDCGKRPQQASEVVAALEPFVALTSTGTAQPSSALAVARMAPLGTGWRGCPPDCRRWLAGGPNGPRPYARGPARLGKSAQGRRSRHRRRQGDGAAGGSARFGGSALRCPANANWKFGIKASPSTARMSSWN